MINLIACFGTDRGIGRNGKQIWKFRADTEFFKETTLGHVVVMGGETRRCIGKPLMGRTELILSRTDGDYTWGHICHSVPELSKAVSEYLEDNREIFVIGGQSLYELFLPLADTMYLTEVKKFTNGADRFFPEFDRSEWQRELLDFGYIDNTEFEINKYYRISEKNLDLLSIL